MADTLSVQLDDLLDRLRADYPDTSDPVLAEAMRQALQSERLFGRVEAEDIEMVIRANLAHREARARLTAQADLRAASGS